ncbi:hypothetical protein KP509_23G087000 [Ceratopteris richardii]|uniref:BRCT domain-containing protein n=1 Tax=Ceratopteris richardii TaxID=49495 RepID=A0A8T2S569_CERRI|nr:hypothetical protein KP509_23G087000 [Ceratopteris richardii]
MEEHVQCKWEVCLCSSEAEVHDSSNVLKSELYRVWQTAQPTEEAWIILEAHPPSAFSELEIVNAGSALIEVFGLPDDCPPQNDDNGYMMLLSSQQLMSTKDVINKANRNRLFTYTCSDKLSRLAMQHRWRRIKVLCRQPFGSEEHKTSIGLSRLNFKSCKTLAEVAADAAEARVQQNLKADLAKMFPKGASNTGSEVVSPVTDSSRALEKQKSMKDVEKNIMASKPDNPPSSHGKRKLPPWQSFNKETKKVVDDEIMSHKPVLSEEEEEHPKDFKGKKVAPKISSPDRKEPPTPNDKKGLPGKEEKEAYTSSKKRTNTQQKHANVLLLDTLPQSRGDFKAHSGLDENSKMESSGSRSGSDPSKARNGSNSSGSKVIQSKQNVSPQVLKSESSSERQKQLVSRVAGKEGDTSGSDDQRGPMQSDEKLHGPKQDESNVPLFSKIMDGVTFVLSGFVNPERAELREKVMQMGGQYCPDWGDDCTLLICAFLNTPKFNQVKKQNGTIVSKFYRLGSRSAIDRSDL